MCNLPKCVQKVGLADINFELFAGEGRTIWNSFLVKIRKVCRTETLPGMCLCFRHF
jgi:hypothetical protein